ncbi:MAG: Fic family protein [bacterium]|nr:Fic family protein [bacterium]
MDYNPPYTLSEHAVTLIAEIAGAAERFSLALEGPDGILLRKINHVHTIRGTTAIEGNTLTEAQITAVLDGKRVAAPKREIEEIRGAHAAYELLGKVDPYSERDLLSVHRAMVGGLVGSAGSFRTKGVGVVDGSGRVLHMAPPADLVPELMGNLFTWVRNSTAHPLVKSSVFHYEFEFIHPFDDGNGRVGRFLQTAMLGRWKEIFHAAPIENIVFENQEGYYRSIQESTARADAGPFVDFMLERIWETIERKGVLKDVPINVPIKDRVFNVISGRPGLNRVRLAEMLSVDVKSIGRALADLGDKVEHRGSKKSGGYFVRGA